LNKKTGYSLCFKNDGLTAMSVSRLEHGRWRIDDLDQSRAAGRASSSLARELGRKPERLTMMMPGNSVRTSLVSLPKLKKKEMNLAAAGWVAREEASTKDEWCVSWRQRKEGDREDQKNRKDVFLLYAPKEDVDKQMAGADAWGTTPTRLLPDYMILDQMFRRYHAEAASLEAWNIVFVGQEDHFLSVSTQASLLLTRPLSGDLSDGADAGEYLERLATEVDRSIFFARQTEYSPVIQRIIVCGDPDLARGLIEKLGKETTVSAEYWDVAECFEWEGRKLDSRLVLPAMAAALDIHNLSFNLLPESSRNFLGPLVRRRLALAVSTAAVAVVPILMAGGFVTANIQDRYLQRARLQLEQASTRADAAAEIYKAQRVLAAREQHITHFVASEQNYAGVLLHLAGLTPEQVIFKDLRLKESSDGRLVLFLSGESNSDTVASAQQSFLTFQKALKSSNLLAAAGEPRKLVISSKTDRGEDIKKVEFSMEYRVQVDSPDQAGEAAVAVLGAR
jgi:Tfp pilus assembly protein PilN